VHDTELAVKLGIAADCAQAPPFQLSVSPSLATPKQKVAEGQDTATRPLLPGTGCAAQEVPFHCHAAGPGPVALKPTASQKLVDTHDTPFMTALTPFDDWAGPGVDWICHDVPFQP
jgi:hypothetical protein